MRVFISSTGLMECALRLLAAVILAAGLSIAWPAGNMLAADEELSDTGIRIAVLTALENEREVPEHLIDVNVEEGIVTLAGSVANILARDRAVEVAGMVKGVRSVVNRIVVKPVRRPDNELLADVKKALLADPAAEAFEVTVNVDEGTVELGGVVDSWAEKTLAAEVVKGVRGVRNVINNIDVDYAGDRSDEEMEADIRRRLESDVRVLDRLIEVKVEQGRAELSGTVASAAEKSRAYSDALLVHGVQSVDMEALQVDWNAASRVRRENLESVRGEQDILRAIKDAYRQDPRVDEANPEVTVESGAVTLSGKVESLQAKLAAEQDAENTLGVWRVKNYLKVRPGLDLGDSEIEESVDQALSRDPYLDMFDLRLAVDNGVVSLYGSADLPFEKERAERVASSVTGVVAVENHMRVADSRSRSEDWELREDIIAAIRWDPHLDVGDMDVDVENGKVTLKGSVDTWYQRSEAAKLARRSGARQVVNLLGVDYGPSVYSAR